MSLPFSGKSIWTHIDHTFFSMDWFKGKFTGNQSYFPMKIMGLSCKISLNPIHWFLEFEACFQGWSPAFHGSHIEKPRAWPSSSTWACARPAAWARVRRAVPVKPVKRWRHGKVHEKSMVDISTMEFSDINGCTSDELHKWMYIESSINPWNKWMYIEDFPNEWAYFGSHNIHELGWYIYHKP